LAPDGLDPAEGFLDALADALARPIAGMPRGAPVDRRTAAAHILRDMRPHPHRAQLIDEVLHIIILVAAKGDRPRPVGARLDHGERRHPLGVPVCPRQARIHEEP
jgi:hypothetical protein